MKTFKQLFVENLSSSVKAFSAMGGADASKYPYSMADKNVLIKNIKRNKPITAYRGYHLKEAEVQGLVEAGKWEVGSILVEKGLNSFSKDKNRRGAFAGGGEIAIYLEIKIKTYLDISGLSIYPEEQEILVNNLKWKIIKIPEARTWYLIGKEI
jgi:hypothetical protein